MEPADVYLWRDLEEVNRDTAEGVLNGCPVAPVASAKILLVIQPSVLAKQFSKVAEVKK